ncbi:hypothetical protein ACQJBY_035348 [Aegilops geniculata]
MAQTTDTPLSPEDPTQRLPVDLLSDVLRRLQTTSPPSLAVSRCVCKAWRDVVDTSRLLVDLLPRSLSGIFVHLSGDTRELLTQYFSPAMPSTSIPAAFDHVDAECSTIKQHCNGLLLLDNEWPRGRGPIKEKAWVLNPATRGWERLPPPPPMCTPGMEDVFDFYIEKVMRCHNQYLVFDPAVSPHYEVFLVKRVPSLPWPSHEYYMEDHVAEREWPPSTFVLLVFSSRTKRWEERPFIRQGEAAATIGYMFDDFPCPQCYAAYWRGALYVHQNGFILRYFIMGLTS